MRYSVALPFGLFAANVAAILDHPALWSNLDFIAPTLDGLPAAGLDITAWNNGLMSKGCRDRAVADGKDPTGFTQYTIKLSDCSQEWYLCQQNGAAEAVIAVAANFARLPVRMRQWVNDVVHYAGGSGAYAIGNHIVLNGPSASTAVMIHEATHCVDGSDGFYSMQSGDQEWVDAYNSDTSVPDNYARTNQAENLAQFPGLIIYDRWTNGALQQKPELPGIGHQLQKVADQGDWSSQYGGRVLDPFTSSLTCTRRWALSPHVNPSTGAVSSIVSVMGTISNILVVPEPVGVTYTATNCSIV
ncbi:hypothetical protein GQ53DRAFT_825734 [Thozetella sp. PMI_491]|nr:hypothetical protein GQ53DRAFT_825734 [Thozetella sp. PMI_491]